MAQVTGTNTVKLNNGQTVTAQTGGWYDGQQFWNGSLSNPGQINSQSNQQGAGQQVSQEVVKQTNPANVAYIQQQQQQQPVTQQVTPQPYNGGNAPAEAGGTSLGMPSAQAALNLPDLYQRLHDASGINELQDEYSQKEKAYLDAQKTINDNPFLSEGTRTGRVAKLSKDFEGATANLKNDIATRKADVETQLNLATKQFDINSQSAQQALSQFNSLLQSGALNNATGEDIANITRSTGLSSSMIQSAINANKAKDVKTSTIQFDDGTNQGFAIINDQTGEIISKQTVAASKPKASTASNNIDTKQFENDKKLAPAAAREAATHGKTFTDMLNFYSQWLTPQEIYQIYNSVNYYKKPAQLSKEQAASLGIKLK